MKILRLTAENVKKIKVVDISPDGSVVQITGPNGSGKSSVLDCIWFALGGTRGIDSKPVRTGTLKAKIKLDLGEIIVTRSFTREGGTSLVVEAENGARFPSPQKMLDDLLGSLTFDPLAFSRMEPKAQLDVLRGMVQLDVDIDELDRLNARDYAERTEASKRAKSLSAQCAALMNRFPAGASFPAEPIDISELLVEMEAASEHNARIERDASRRERELDELSRLRSQITELHENARRAKESADELEAQFWERDRALRDSADLPEVIDLAEIREEIEHARVKNQYADLAHQHDEVLGATKTAEGQVWALTDAIDARKTAIAAAIAAADMPIDGLSFGDGEVLYNDLPFSQASSAEQLRVSVAIAMAANPKLRVLRIKDGSLLDENGLALIADMASENDYQVWIERVDTTGKVGIVMEDGAIVGAEDLEPALVGADEE